jgi:ABC-type multidrug transport system ATPase subunit
MDEAEALSTKMGIMVKGGIFKCFGPSQHIRNKFGTGYVVELKIRSLSQLEVKLARDQYFDESREVVLDRFNFSEKVVKLIREDCNAPTFDDQVRQVHADAMLYSAIMKFAEIFGQVELLEKYGSYGRIRVKRLDKSIGFLFGLVEEIKEEMDISEYSVS